MNNELSPRIKTPCIGVCSTGIGDNVCRGCKRFAHEIIHWNSYSEPQKQIIDRRLESFLCQIVASKLKVVDVNLLQWHLEAQNIPYQTSKDACIWAYELLRAGANQIDDIRQYGLQLETSFSDYSLPAIRSLIDDEFYILSSAHYERYFALDCEQDDVVIDCD